jgi:hypothetical protein
MREHQPHGSSLVLSVRRAVTQRKSMHIREKRWREKRLRERVIRKARRCSLTAREIFWFNCRWLIHFWSRCWLVVEVLVYIRTHVLCIYLYTPKYYAESVQKSPKQHGYKYSGACSVGGPSHSHRQSQRVTAAHSINPSHPPLEGAGGHHMFLALKYTPGHTSCGAKHARAQVFGRLPRV